VSLAVAAAGVYLVRQTWRAWKVRRSGCGGCGCAGKPGAESHGLAALIPPEQLSVRARPAKE